MKRALLVTIALLAACGSDPGAVEVHWSFQPDRANGCEGEPVVASVRATLVEGAFQYTQEVQCRVGQSILIPDVEAGSYALIVDALTDDDPPISVLAASETGVQVDEGKTQVIDVVLEPKPGTIELAWRLPTNCTIDGVHDIRIIAIDDGFTAHDNVEDLEGCGEDVVTIEGNWIRSREFPRFSIYVYGVDIGGVRTHDWADCDLDLRSGIVNEVLAELTACGGGDCCPGELCRVLCPAD